MDLTPATVPLIRAAFREALAAHAPEGLTGVSCIAAGADSIFAEVVLELGGDLEVILPAADYREHKVKPDHAELFDSLVRRAARVWVMPHDVSNRAAYEAANEALLDSVDLLLAVWDGRAPADRGGTAAVIEDARSRKLDIKIIWPDDAKRISHSQP
ncbi:SLOG family protein [Protofrankia symbiont of Coriaria ruscifolia]|uniref:SLOG family protein n=1 Tax=Protofrankia symbiont of Coriaria ruscifolia TaxID=1306542 RepID=UPI001A945791|nr:SLOG family protein [Protofrankia symbiont of Coriaria ruscifolia]